MKTCVNCSHFAYWDGDWCCCAQLKLLSEIENDKTVNPENCERDRSDCPDWEDDTADSTPERTKFRREEWEFFR